MVVYSWWCWHIYKGGGVPRVERGVSSSLPPAELANFLKSAESRLASSARFGAFEKIKCIFSIASVGNLEKSRKKHSSDAGVGITGR